MSYDPRIRINILDKGYLRHIESWGRGDSGIREAAIIEAARMSTGKGFNGWDAVECKVCKLVLHRPQQHTSEPGIFCPNKTEFKDIGDKKLLSFLYDKKHMTPFEMAGMTLEISAPIFVFREWHRHRTQSYNEMSARYIPLPNENYLPEIENLLNRSKEAAETKNRQASGTGIILGKDVALIGLDKLFQYYQLGQELYEELLADGWPKELARLPVPVARYSRMRASGNLRNWLAFLTLRLDPNAQWEIRQYAVAVSRIIEEEFPRTSTKFHAT